MAELNQAVPEARVGGGAGPAAAPGRTLWGPAPGELAFSALRFIRSAERSAAFSASKEGAP